MAKLDAIALIKRIAKMANAAVLAKGVVQLKLANQLAKAKEMRLAPALLNRAVAVNNFLKAL